jgi:membrane protease YdiL (CAAX protease family)
VTRKTVSAITLAVALLGPETLVVFGDRVFGDTPRPAIVFLLQLVFCGIAAGVLFVVARVERLPLSSIGIRRPGRDTVLTILVLAAAAWLLSLITQPLVRATVDVGKVEAVTQKILALPLWLRVVIAATSGFAEEILYRGYAIERLSTFTGRRWLGASLAALIFGLAHIPAWGVPFALAADLPFGVLMTACYLWRRDLIANGAVHSGGLVVALCF